MAVRTFCYNLFYFSFPPLGLFQTESSQVPTTGRGEKARSSLRRIPSVWTSSWRRPSSTAAPRGRPPAAARRTTTTTRSAGRSENGREQSPCRAAASMLEEDEEVVFTVSKAERCFNILKSLSGMICQIFLFSFSVREGYFSPFFPRLNTLHIAQVELN